MIETKSGHYVVTLEKKELITEVVFFHENAD